ncbi:MAG TPA: tetrahydromethanopterin S-methyltransferase subunit G [Methanocella sp.]|uniref:tetrahydromethanopterin S-methyltransferase subunit MtrG n=1 Tax=Methanocella sp. TaxID=2052833 RepID=UPI002B76FC3D|nr:tetrahydromethanopterin S-methyltransferase subunit G [Methanocella sp.]HTY89607.1 tetrahydromethanopterin S-methyltransferase subunit G [Methanocella sp.]
MIPAAAVDPVEFSAVQKRLDAIEEKVEFTNSEIQQSAGITLGREVGILYGFLFGVLIYVAYSIIMSIV